jgi:hypothetical protein
MRALRGEVLLAAWDEGGHAHEQRRPLALLSAALPGSDRAVLGAMPIAERNLLLLQVHEGSFGPALDVYGVCLACSAPLEFSVPASEMAARLAAGTAVHAVEWTEDGHRYRLRRVTTDDLIASLHVPDVAAAQEFLLTRCLEVLAPSGAERTVAPPGAAHKFEQLHADAEFGCAVECPHCRAQQVLDLDIARFLWLEIRRAAVRLLGEIHLLASAYGWREEDIAGMSPDRRAAYLELVSPL